jgi:hypothetical protein
MPMNFRILSVACIATALFAVPALGHHSFAMFDQEKTVELSGVIKEFQWTNPHSWLVVNVTNAQGQVEEWGLEMGSPAGLARRGWRPRTTVPGDKVTFKAHPYRNGDPGGQFVSVTLPDGKEMVD